MPFEENNIGGWARKVLAEKRDVKWLPKRPNRFCGFCPGPGSRLPRLHTELGSTLQGLKKVSCELGTLLDAVMVTKAV